MVWMTLWDFLSPRKENLILRWTRQNRLYERDRAKLNQKLDRLQQLDFNLATRTGMLIGPLHGQEHIFKLVVNGNVKMRPLLCKGPINERSEYTLLLGVVQRDGRFPPDAAQKAESNRGAVLKDPERRQLHERF